MLGTPFRAGPPAFQFVDRICEGRPWRFQIDYFGICNVLHNLLHNEYMQIEYAVPSGRHGDPSLGTRRAWVQGETRTTSLNLSGAAPAVH